MKLEWLSYRRWRPHDRIFICLDKTPSRDGRTDGPTDLPWQLQRSALQILDGPWKKARCHYTPRPQSNRILQYFVVNVINGLCSESRAVHFLLLLVESASFVICPTAISKHEHSVDFQSSSKRGSHMIWRNFCVVFKFLFYASLR